MALILMTQNPEIHFALSNSVLLFSLSALVSFAGTWGVMRFRVAKVEKSIIETNKRIDDIDKKRESMKDDLNAKMQEMKFEINSNMQEISLKLAEVHTIVVNKLK